MKMMKILLCTDDTLVVRPESTLPAEAAIGKQVEYRSCQFVPTDFKGVDVIQEGDDLVMSQIAYINTERKVSNPPVAFTKSELHR